MTLAEGGALTTDPESFIAAAPVLTSHPHRSHAPKRSQSAPPTQPGIGQRRATAALLDRSLLVPAKPLRGNPTWKECAINIVRYSYLNVLLVFVPISWALHFAGVSDTAIFCTSALAIVPCAALLGFATEELALRLGDTLGGLLNATFGNVVELIIAILALVKGELDIVKSAMIGSILSNCLLVLGCAFLAGGIRFHEQNYKIHSAQVNISMLGLIVLAVVLPSALYSAAAALQEDDASVTGEALAAARAQANTDILKLSRGIAVILIFVYACYLLFQLWTHAYMYGPESADLSINEKDREDGRTGPVNAGASDSSSVSRLGGNNVFRLPERRLWRRSSNASASTTSTEHDPNEPKLKVKAAIALILGITVIAGLTAEWLVSSIDGLVAGTSISEEWTALILLPLIGNAAEHWAAVSVSVKGKIDLSMAVAVGSSCQIALFVLPFLIILAWIIGQPLTLLYDIFQTVTLAISIVIVNWAIQDGKTNWLEGCALISTYLIIALTFWFYPGA